MKLLLSNIAAMHASSIAYELDEGKTIGSQLGDKLFETSIAKHLDWFRTGVLVSFTYISLQNASISFVVPKQFPKSICAHSFQGFQAVLAAHPKYQSAEHQHFIQKKFLEAVEPAYEMVNESSRFKNVLCHRDTWMNNVLFISKDENWEHPTKAVLVDFQFCRYCPPAIDVTLAIYLNCSPSTRAVMFPLCLEWYYSELTTELNALNIRIDEHIPWEAFLESCDHLKLVSLLYNAVVTTWVRLPSGVMEDMQLNDPEKFAKFRTVSRREVLLDLIEKDEKYRKYMFEETEYFMEVIYKN